MTTEPEPVQAEYIPPTPFPEAGYMVFGVPGVPYSSVRIPLVYDAAQQNVLIAHAIEAGKILLEAFNDEFGAEPARQTERPASVQPRQEAPQRAPQGQQGQTRASQYPRIPDMACDVCNGPVGRYPARGNMRGDKAVCLGRCKDGQYVHTVGWLDE